jgi:RNA polymerase sigma factor (TIGR02999 family)
MEKSSANITELLLKWNEGDAEALENLMPLVENELRRIAHRFMRRENPQHTLQTTALVNEVYLKLIDQRSANWQNRLHFFALSSKMMRRILLNHARDRLAQKRGGNFEKVSLETVETLSLSKSRELIALDEALEALAHFDPLKSRIVELRYFGGLSLEETANILNIATVTVSKHWQFARAWLKKEISGENSDSGQSQK